MFRSDSYMQKISRDLAIEEVIKFTSEIAKSKQVEDLFKLAKEGKREELEKKVDRFMNSKLYRKIKEFDERFPTGPLFIAKIKEEIKGYKYSELKPYERGRINSKALLFLILAMPTNEEKDFFENYEDLVNYLKEDGEKELADYLKKYWLSGNILDILWEIYDQED